MGKKRQKKVRARSEAPAGVDAQGLVDALAQIVDKLRALERPVPGATRPGLFPRGIDSFSVAISVGPWSLSLRLQGPAGTAAPAVLPARRAGTALSASLAECPDVDCPVGQAGVPDFAEMKVGDAKALAQSCGGWGLAECDSSGAPVHSPEIPDSMNDRTIRANCEHNPPQQCRNTGGNLGVELRSEPPAARARRR
jgi:hypothetical protein